MSDNSDKYAVGMLNGAPAERERRLSQIANSVSGFYRGAENASEHSLMQSTHESNFAHNVGGR